MGLLLKKMSNTMCLDMFLILLLSFSTAMATDTSSPICETIQSPISQTIFSLCSELIKEMGDDNFFFSPLSISAALAMIYVGTQGTTKDQMTRALGYKALGDKCLNLRVSEEFRNLILSLETKNDSYSLLIANSVFIHSAYPVSNDYILRLQEYFRTDVNYFDFTNDETATMKAINEWVANRTSGQIPQLLNEPLDPLTIMILMNVVYFKGLWEHPFPVDNTWNSFFYRNNSTSKIVPFMMVEESLGYYYDKTINYSFLELGYKGGKVSMLLILPKNIREFPRFELDSKTLCNIRSKLEPSNIMVILPKFRMDFTRELSRDMMKMGMEELFSDKADLSGIREQNDIHVSLMIHKAVIEVDERGSEASVVSGVGIVSRRKPSDQMIFWADHPFLFYIIDKERNVVLFAGRVTDP